MPGDQSFCPLCGASLDSPARTRLVRCTACGQRIRPRSTKPRASEKPKPPSNNRRVQTEVLDPWD